MSRRSALAFAVMLVLAIAQTWPIATSPGRLFFTGNADADLNAWIVSWIPHALATSPWHLFDGNIFAPEPDTLAYSEPLVVPALAGAPLRVLGASPVLVFNVLLIAGLALTGWATWCLVWRWTGSSSAALVSGALGAFNVHLLTRLPHLQAAHAWGLPLTLLAGDVLVSTGSRRAFVATALVIAAVAMTSMYLLVFAWLIVIVLAVASLRRPRAAVTLIASAAIGCLLAAPILWPYVQLARHGTTRPLEVVAQFVATPGGYLTSTSVVDRGWTRPFFTTDVDVFFAGAAALALTIVGIVAARYGDAVQRRRTVVLIAIAGLAVLMSFGPTTAIYRELYHWVPPLQGIRAPARFGYLALLVVAILAGYGVAWIETRVASRRLARFVAPLALVVVMAEAWQGSAPVTTFDGVPRVYDLLASSPRPVLLVEVPFYPADAAFENGEYVLNATAHWQPVMNGYSGVTPDSYRERAPIFWRFPDDDAFEAMKAAGATHIMVHLARFGPDAPTVLRAIQARTDLELQAADRAGNRLYVVTRGARTVGTVGALRDSTVARPSRERRDH